MLSFIVFSGNLISPPLLSLTPANGTKCFCKWQFLEIQILVSPRHWTTNTFGTLLVPFSLPRSGDFYTMASFKAPSSMLSLMKQHPRFLSSWWVHVYGDRVYIGEANGILVFTIFFCLSPRFRDKCVSGKNFHPHAPSFK